MSRILDLNIYAGLDIIKKFSVAFAKFLHF